MRALTDLLLDTDAAPTEPLVRWGEQVHTREEIAEASARLATTLVGMGAAPDSAVAALVPSTPLGLVMLFGIWRAGAIAAPLESGAAAAEVDRLVADVRPAVVVRPSLDDTSLVPQVAVRPGEPRHHAADLALIATAPDPGTSRARRVELTHDAVLAAATGAAGTLRGWGVQLVPVPLASPAGLDGALVATAQGGMAVLLDPCSPEAFAAAARRFAVEVAMATPDLVAALVAAEGLTTLEPLRYLRAVGGGISPDAARAFRARFGVTVLGGYARPELGGEVVGWSAGDAAVHGDVKLGSAGRPFAGVEVRVLRSDHTEADPDEVGALWVRAHSAMRGYLTDRVETAPRVDADDFLHLGDRGRIDPDGFLWIV